MLKMQRVLAVIFVLCIGQSVLGQGGEEVTLEAELSRARAYIGDVVTYQVLVRGADDGTAPVVEFPAGVVAEYRGASSQKFTTMRSINGRQRSVTDAYYKHQYLLTVVEEGVIVIPAAELMHGGKRYVSEPARMTALLPALSEKDRIVVTMPDRAIYAGESVVAHVSWWVADQTGSLSFASSMFPDSIRVTPASPAGRSGEEHQLELFGQRFVAYVDQAIFEGQPMTRLRFDLVLTPTRAGSFDFGPVRVVFTRQDDFSRAARMYAQSSVETVHVIEVPVVGRPAGYAGMIGSFRAQTDASNQQVNVGDPIEFRLLVSGPEPMIGLEETLDAQKLSDMGFRVSPDGWREVERRRNGERLFATTIRATDDQVSEIPAVKLPAFNPDSGEFETFASAPIPLDVRAVRSVTLSDAVTSSPTEIASGGVQRSELAMNPSLLWAHPEPESLRASSREFSLWGVLGDPVWIVTLALVGGVPLVAWGARGAARRSDPRAVAIERAWKKAKRLHGKGDDVGAIREYGGAILGIEPGSLTGADLKHLEVSQEIVARSSAVLSESESVHYGTLAEGHSDESLLRAMRRDLRRHGAHSKTRRARR